MLPARNWRFNQRIQGHALFIEATGTDCVGAGDDRLVVSNPVAETPNGLEPPVNDLSGNMGMRESFVQTLTPNGIVAGPDEIGPKSEIQLRDDLADGRSRANLCAREGEHVRHRQSEIEVARCRIRPRQWQMILNPIRSVEVLTEDVVDAIANSDFQTVEESENCLRKQDISLI